MSEHSYLDNISIEQYYSTFIKKKEILFGVDISQGLLKRLKILIKNESEESFHVVYVFCVKTWCLNYGYGHAYHIGDIQKLGRQEGVGGWSVKCLRL